MSSFCYYYISEIFFCATTSNFPERRRFRSWPSGLQACRTVPAVRKNSTASVDPKYRSSCYVRNASNRLSDITALQSRKPHSNISYFYCGCALYVVSNNTCIFYGINFLRLFHCLLTFYASVFFYNFFYLVAQKLVLRLAALHSPGVFGTVPFSDVQNIGTADQKL